MILNLMEMRLKVKNRSHRCDTNRPRHGHKYSKYKMCHSMMALVCIQQHLINIWSPIDKKVTQHQRKRSLKKKTYKKA